MLGAVSERRWVLRRKDSASWDCERRFVLEWAEWSETASSVWLDNGLAVAPRCRVLFRLESPPRSRMLFATNEAGREWLGVVFLLEMRLSSGLGLAGVAGGGLGSRFELELAMLHGLSRRLSGDL